MKKIDLTSFYTYKIFMREIDSLKNELEIYINEISNFELSLMC